jgi:hypothetical protein
MSNIIGPEEFLTAYIRLFQDATEPAWPGDKKHRTKFATSAAMRVIREAKLEADFPIEPLTATKEYFRVDVIGDEGVDDRDCNWLLRVAFEHENPGWHCPDKKWGAPPRRPTWIQELCKLTHVVADLRVLAGYYDAEEDSKDLQKLLQSNVDRMQKHQRMTRIPIGKWLFIFGVKLPGTSHFRAFTLDGDNRTTVKELQVPSSQVRA